MHTFVKLFISCLIGISINDWTDPPDWDESTERPTWGSDYQLSDFHKRIFGMRQPGDYQIEPIIPPFFPLPQFGDYQNQPKPRPTRSPFPGRITRFRQGMFGQNLPQDYMFFG